MAARNAEAFPVSNENGNISDGLTKREYAAIHILAGLVGAHLSENSMTNVRDGVRARTVDLAVELADMLMRKL